MPISIVPMLAKAGVLPDSDDNYAYEIKWDGIRAITYIRGGMVVLQSRNLLDFTHQYPELQQLAKPMGRASAVLDGEIVAFNEEGVPSFERLQGRMGLTAEKVRQRRRTNAPITYMIFDLLYFDGQNLMELPYLERRRRLEALALNGPCWQTPGYHVGDGPAMLEASRKKRLEGVVAKRIDSHYEPGLRSGAWRKIKNVLRQEFVIGGWLPGEGSRLGQIGSLLVGYYDIVPTQRRVPQRLLFAGKVGTGFTDATLRSLAALLEPLKRAERPFADDPKYRQARFVEPRLVCEVEFTEWTSDGKLRHPSYKGLRPDKNPLEVVREIPTGNEQEK
ncbi:MAG TPA: non-homologous end-joining DNA ligase [Planctomycetota bacterium]|jgi:bifunctional non-homologous end joining protein LigD